MKIAAIFILGALIGWLIEWVIDWLYWRRRIAALTKQNNDLSQENQRLKNRVESKTKSTLRSSKTKLVRKGGKDNLQAIRGIGPVIEKLLNQAGIYSFEELAQLAPDELTEILGDLIRRFFPGEDKMIAQAQEFARQKSNVG